jgi:F-type H+-transporting ATPase subunit delta
MNESKISVRYAKAIIEQAREEKILGLIKTDMDFIGSCIAQVPELKIIIESPVIKPSEKKSMMRNSIGENLQPLSVSFIDLIFTNKRETYLESICRHFLYLYNKEMGIKPAMLITPKKLDSSVREKIVSLISRKLNVKIELEERADEKLLGGFLLRIEDQQIDTSIASQLAKIRKEFSN